MCVLSCFSSFLLFVCSISEAFQRKQAFNNQFLNPQNLVTVRKNCILLRLGGASLASVKPPTVFFFPRRIYTSQITLTLSFSNSTINSRLTGENSEETESRRTAQQTSQNEYNTIQTPKMSQIRFSLRAPSSQARQRVSQARRHLCRGGCSRWRSRSRSTHSRLAEEWTKPSSPKRSTTTTKPRPLAPLFSQ